MFEKEAEEYADGIYHYKINVSDYGEDGKINYRYSDIKEAHQKGAEFGYNKANEWHYVKDGDLPKEEGTYLVYISGNLLVDRWHNGKWMLHFNTDAWKEIVLPELKESE